MNHSLLCAPTPRKASVEQYITQLSSRLGRLAGHYARRTRLDRDDLLQEAWRGVLDGWNRLDITIGSPPQFLIRCAKWRMLSYCRKAYRTVNPTLVCEPCQLDPALELVDVRLDTATLRGRLSQQQQELIDHLLEGMTFREIGLAMGCTSANVAYHMRQIRSAFSESPAAGDREGEVQPHANAGEHSERRCPMKVTGKAGEAR